MLIPKIYENIKWQLHNPSFRVWASVDPSVGFVNELLVKSLEISLCPYWILDYVLGFLDFG